MNSDARSLTAALGGTWHGSYGRARCPVCGGNPANPPFSITRGLKGPLVYCHKGCDFATIADALRGLGLDAALREQDTGANVIELRQAASDESKKKADQARRCWLDCTDISGTPAERYLIRRGITVTPDNVRFHEACWHGPTGHRYPAMVSLVEGGAGFSVHRTYISADGHKAAIAPNKMTLGPMRGGAIRLIGKDTDRLIVGEGIETVLSAATLLPQAGSAWAALSASGVKALRLPETPGHLILAPDGDPVGRAASTALGERAHALGWDVSWFDPGTGCDWNDRLGGAS